MSLGSFGQSTPPPTSRSRTSPRALAMLPGPAATIKGPNPTGDRLSLLWQADTNLMAWWEEYLPERNAWYPFSKRFVTAAAVVLPGGTIRGTTFPWGAEGLRRYFCDPAAV